MEIHVYSWYWFTNFVFVHLCTNWSVLGIKQDQTVQFAQFITLKSNNSYLCAKSSPDVTVSATTPQQYILGCQRLKPDSCVGVNYRQQSNKCEMFFNNPLSFVNITGFLVQQHYNGNTFFDPTWQEFKVGFGDVTGDYWIGNEQLHSLTKIGRYRLRVDLQLKGDQSWQWAEYNTFIGNTYNSFVSQTTANLNGMKFTTRDRNNDFYSGNCHYKNRCCDRVL